MPDFHTFTVDEVKFVHTRILMESHEEALDLILNQGSLEIAISAPMRVVYETEIYPDVVSKAAVMMYELTTLHPFVEGNKRTAFLCADMLLVLNDHLLVANNEERTEVSLRVARMGMNRDNLIDWFREKTIETAMNQAEDEKFMTVTKRIKKNSNVLLGRR
jgi:death-on-curing protein